MDSSPIGSYRVLLGFISGFFMVVHGLLVPSFTEFYRVFSFDSSPSFVSSYRVLPGFPSGFLIITDGLVVPSFTEFYRVFFHLNSSPSFVSLYRVLPSIPFLNHH